MGKVFFYGWAEEVPPGNLVKNYRGGKTVKRNLTASREKTIGNLCNVLKISVF